MVFAAFVSFKANYEASCRFWVLVFFFFVVAYNTECKSIASNIKDLKEELLKNYDKHVRPSVNQTAATDVDMNFEVQHIIEMDEKQQSLTVKGHLMLLWTDDRLNWKPEDHGDVRNLRFNKSEIWIPDVVVLNSLGENEVGAKSTVYAVHTGVLKRSPSMVIKAACGTKLRHYPFDEHNCTLAFGSWTYGRKINLQALSISTDSSNLPSASGWQVQDITQKLNTENYYVEIDVTIFLKRTSAIYKYVCVVPTVLTVVVTLAGFWLQAAEPARYVLGCSNFIMMSLLLQHLVTTVPSGNEIPIIAEYSASCLCMSCIFILVTIVVNIVSRKTTPPPAQLVRFARNVLCRWLCLTTFMQPAFTKKQAISTISDIHPNRMAYFDEQISLAGDWLILSLVIDRIAFWIFTFIFVVLMGVLIGI